MEKEIFFFLHNILKFFINYYLLLGNKSIIRNIIDVSVLYCGVILVWVFRLAYAYQCLYSFLGVFLLLYVFYFFETIHKPQILFCP